MNSAKLCPRPDCSPSRQQVKSFRREASRRKVRTRLRTQFEISLERILDPARNDKDYSFDSGTAFSAALKPILECVPSQKGFSVDAPQRHSAMRFSTGNLFPSASINSTSPVTM